MKLYRIKDIEESEKYIQSARYDEKCFVETLMVCGTDNFLVFGKEVLFLLPNIREVIDVAKLRISDDILSTFKRYIKAFDSYDFFLRKKEECALNINRQKWQNELDKCANTMMECAEIMEMDLSPFKWHVYRYDSGSKKLFMFELVKEDDYVWIYIYKHSKILAG